MSELGVRRLRWLLVGALLLFVAPMFAEPFGIASGDAWRDNDWLNNRTFDVLSRRALLEHGQFPLRSELVGGGFPILGHPSDGSWAPTLPLVLLFGAVIGAKLNLVLLLLAGVWGMHGLARRWLGLSEPAALGAAAAFGVSGWFPSTLLVGFYPQALLLLTPAVLYLLLGRGRRAWLGAGALLFVVLQQAGNGFATLGFFLAAFAVVDAGVHRDPARARRLVGMLAAAALVAALLGIGKLVPLADVVAGGTYAHEDFEPLGPRDAPPPGGVPLAAPPDADFWNGPRGMLEGLLTRAPDVGVYGAYPPPPAGVELEERPHGLAIGEFGHLGLTPTLLLLALIGLGAGRRAAGPAVLAVGFAGICLGPHNLIDLHAIGPGWMPVLSGVSQPLKYYDVFVLVALCLLVGLGFEVLGRRWPHERRVAGVVLAALLFLPPYLANRGAFAARFAEVVPDIAAEPYRQVAQIGHPTWASLGAVEIERRRSATFLREFARAPAATEYRSARRGVGVVDWYGTLRLPEHAEPSVFVTPSGARVPNPRYRGEAWIAAGTGEISSVEVTPNRVGLELTTTGPATVVVNQNALEGFSAEGATLVDGELLTMTVAGGGEHRVTLSYRPTGTLAALGASALGAILWLVLFLRPERGRRA